MKSIVYIFFSLLADGTCAGVRCHPDATCDQDHNHLVQCVFVSLVTKETGGSVLVRAAMTESTSLSFLRSSALFSHCLLPTTNVRMRIGTSDALHPIDGL